MSVVVAIQIRSETSCIKYPQSEFQDNPGARKKLGWWSYATVKTHDLSLIRLVTIPVSDRQTDRRTDRLNYYGSKAIIH